MKTKRNLTWKSPLHMIRRVLPRTLFARSLLILVIPILLIQIVTVYVFFDRHWNRMSTRLADALAGEIAGIADQIERNPDPAHIGRIAGYAAQYLDLLVSFNPDAVLSLSPRTHTGRDALVSSLLSPSVTNKVRRPFEITILSHDKRVDVRVQLEGGVLRITLPQRRVFSSSGYVFLLYVLGTSLLVLAVAVLFMRNQIRPIRRLSVAAERFGTGRPVPPLRVEGAIEVRQATQAFLDMHDRIQRQISQRTAMLAGVSHDLRTPLTRLRLNMAMLPESPDVIACREDILAMERMITGYLDFVRGEGDEKPVRTDLRVILEKIVSGFNRHETPEATPRASARLSLSLPEDADFQTLLRPVAIERCLANLIVNARTHAQNVRISAQRTPDEIEILIDDDGAGIPESAYEDVFRPFTRLDSSRNAATGGVGLGLPIARDIVHAHGGTLTLDQSPEKGLRVQVHLPA